MNIVATTNIDSDGESLRFSDLLDMKNHINSERAIRFTIEHDPYFPPIGQLYNARIERNESGKHILVADNFIYEEEIIKVGDEEYVKCTHEKSKPFIEVNKSLVDVNEIFFDFLQFKSRAEKDKFISDLSSIDEILVCGDKKRKSGVLTPEVTLILGTLLVSHFFIPIGKKLLGKIVEDLGDELFNQYSKIKNILLKCLKKFKGKDGKINIILQLPTQDLDIELICSIKINQMDDFMDSILPEELVRVYDRSIKYKELFNAEKIQFVFNNELEWKLNYMLTENGEVIGKKKNFDKRSKIFKKMMKRDKIGLSYTAHLKKVEIQSLNIKKNKGN